jgi:hypothetical protein
MRQLLRLSIPAVASLALVACADDPVSYSEPVTINLKAKSSDVVNNAIDDDKGITTESSNPYGAFVTNARSELGGRDPSSIELESTTLTLGAGSSGVLGLGEVFTGNVEVNFTMNDTDNTYPAAWGAIAAADGSGPITLTSGFATDDLSAADRQLHGGHPRARRRRLRDQGRRRRPAGHAHVHRVRVKAARCGRRC